jgi:HAD superfamily 5'-nucleotidase-like hydrolase
MLAPFARRDSGTAQRVALLLADRAAAIVQTGGVSVPETSPAPPELGVFANRTLNLRSVRAIGYDMDYTLLHYKVDEWEGAAFRHAVTELAARGWPVDELDFDASAFTLGLVFDLDLGNLVKATRFGYVMRAQHGRSMLSYEEQRGSYAEIVVDLAEERFEFMNTMFELSRASLWTQLVDALDGGRLSGIRGYHELYAAIDEALNESHLAGELKEEILADPDRFLEPDAEIVQALLDQRAAGKKLLLITNSEWAYTRDMMQYAFGDSCPPGTTWRDLFDVVIVSAAKPRFFAERRPLYRVVDEEQSLMLPHRGPIEAGHVYFGGDARLVEEALGLQSAQLLYVGDHLFGDVHVTKDLLRWRTALVSRELEAEVLDAIAFSEDQSRLVELMAEKVVLERRQAQLRMQRLRGDGSAELKAELDSITAAAARVDEMVAPLAKASAELGNPTWGPLMRAGNDKSLFARQVERYADVYTSRVSNLRHETPFAYLRAARGSLPHDR